MVVVVVVVVVVLVAVVVVVVDRAANRFRVRVLSDVTRVDTGGHGSANNRGAVMRARGHSLPVRI